MRLLALGDLHSGHGVGLTHPDYNSKDDAIQQVKDGDPFAIDAWKTRNSSWSWFERRVDAYKPFDVVILNGDAIEGKGPRSGGIELLTTNRTKQIAMAKATIDYITDGGKVPLYMTYGTGYHTGTDEDWEFLLAEKAGAVKIGGHDWIDINGVVVDYKHHISGSQVPHSRHTATARERLWNLLWNEHGEFPKADIILRSHVHYYDFCGGRGWVAMTLPALQGLGSHYGSRKMSGRVDFGFVVFDIDGKDDFRWTAEIMEWPRVEATRVDKVEAPKRARRVARSSRSKK